MVEIQERADINSTCSEIMQEHLDRYSFAKLYVKGKRVLDVACGTGYGSYMLSEKASCVYGVDISKSVINDCKHKYKADNLSFIVSNALKMPFDDGYFDVVVSFETIEHIEDYNGFLKECRRVLSQKGVFICSTPNSCVSSPEGVIVNPYHIREFNAVELTDAIKRCFLWVELYGQRDIDYTKNYIIKKCVSIKRKLGIERALFYHKNESVKKYYFPVSYFKNGLVRSCYIIIVAGGYV